MIFKFDVIFGGYGKGDPVIKFGEQVTFNEWVVIGEDFLIFNGDSSGLQTIEESVGLTYGAEDLN